MSWDLPALQELAQFPRWVVWKYVVRDPEKEPTKPPYQLSGALASSTDPATWSPCTEAIRAHVGFDGCGFAIVGTEYCGVDLDHCLTFPPDADGRPVVDPWARAIVDALDSYTEITPSGESLRVWVKGAVPRGRQKTRLGPEQRAKLEIYSGPNRARYFTITGNHLDGTPTTINERQDALTTVYRQYFGEDDPGRRRPDGVADHGHVQEDDHPRVLDDDDRALIARAQSDHGERFARLWDGDRTSYGSASGADFALCAWLTFYTQDPVRLERLMRASRLVRTKWDTKRGSETWIAYTIGRQLEKDRTKPAAPPPPSAPPRPAPTERPLIGLRGGSLGWATRTAWEFLSAQNDPPVILRADGYPVRLDTDQHQAPIIRRLTVAMLRDLLAERIDFKRQLKDGNEVDVDPPKDLCETMLSWAGDRLDLPPLEGVVECPQMLRSGEILATPGYSERSGLFYAPAPGLTVPADMLLVEARRLLDELVQDFPFAARRDKTHALGLALALVGRDVIRGQLPLHLVDAPVPGTGKGLLVDALCWPALGRPIGRMTRSKNEEEERKRLTAALLGRPVAILLDNLSGRLGGDAISAILTSGVWEDRLLGANQIVRIPCRTIFLATANNLATSEEVARRLVQIRLDAGVEQPALRPAKDFMHPDLLDWARAERGRLVRALLTLWTHWFASGSPRFSTTRMGSFENWGEVIGGVLACAGYDDFLAGRESQHDTLDPLLAQWRAFLAAWWSSYGARRIHVRDLWQILTRDMRVDPKPNEPPELRHIEFNYDLDLGGGDIPTLKKKLGRQLQERRDRYFGPYRLKLGDTGKNGREYFLEGPQGV